MYAIQMLEKISVSSAEDSHALQQIYRWETLLKLQVTQSKASWVFLSLFLQRQPLLNLSNFVGLNVEMALLDGKEQVVS